ncbi:MAG: hypothetical protein CMJ18_03690 [Phycisphaeraceae bacterium]|nr:hypothetical protein [Phycisphaeraceae bacterium]
MHRSRSRRFAGFSLIELVIVVVIIGVISAIAIPRMTRGVNNAGGISLKGSLAVLRSSIELYRAEHEGRNPTLGTTPDIVEQLTKFSNVDGTVVSATPVSSTGVIYGPYLKAVPEIPVGTKKGLKAVGSGTGAGLAWDYNATTGDIKAALVATELDFEGIAFNTY